jgi:hypothetical protein
MWVLVQVAVIVCGVAAWVAFIYFFEKRQMKKGRDQSGPSHQTPMSGDFSVGK